MAQRSFGASLENGSNSRRRQHFSANEQRMHTALLAAAELVNATARVGCGPPRAGEEARAQHGGPGAAHARAWRLGVCVIGVRRKYR